MQRSPSNHLRHTATHRVADGHRRFDTARFPLTAWRKSKLVFALSLAFACGSAFAAPNLAEGEPTNAKSRALYSAGHQALQRKEYADALVRFRELEGAQNRSDEPADAALYWQAYTLHELKREDEAAAIVERLQRRYPKSNWLDDARALLPAGSQPVDLDREEQALMAIDAILTTGNPKAVPLLERVLAGQHTDKVKGRAMFVLTQIAPERADAALTAVLRGNGSLKLKREAIQAIGVGGRAESLDALLAIYRDSTEPKLREAVLDAWLVGGRGDLVRDAALNERDPRMQSRAIQRLGAMGDSKAIRTLLPKLTDARSQREAVQALAVAGDVDGLLEVAKSSNEDLRVEAVQSLGIVGRKKGGEAIMQFYAPDQPKRVRRAAIQALVVNGDAERIVQLYRRETDRELKGELLRAITVTGGDEAIEIIDDMLKEPTGK